MYTTITYIYCLYDPIDNLPKYIGKSNLPYKRYNEHINESINTNTKTKKLNWLRKLNNLNKKPILEIIDIVLENEWSFWERYYISLYKSWGFDLKNGTFGGDGCSKFDNPMYGKLGKDNPRYGTKHTEKTKQKMSIKATGINNGFYNKKHTQNSLLKIYNASKGENNPNYGGKLHTEEYINKQIISNSKVPIIIYDIVENKKYEFINSKQAGNFINISDAKIRKYKNTNKIFFERYKIFDK